jgi:hypothetical protein
MALLMGPCHMVLQESQWWIWGNEDGFVEDADAEIVEKKITTHSAQLVKFSLGKKERTYLSPDLVVDPVELQWVHQCPSFKWRHWPCQWGEHAWVVTCAESRMISYGCGMCAPVCIHSPLVPRVARSCQASQLLWLWSRTFVATDLSFFSLSNWDLHCPNYCEGLWTGELPHLPMHVLSTHQNRHILNLHIFLPKNVLLWRFILCTARKVTHQAYSSAKPIQIPYIINSIMPPPPLTSWRFTALTTIHIIPS